MTSNTLPPDYWIDKWSFAVRTRDNFTCMMCKCYLPKGGRIQAHHIMPKSKYPELACRLENGISLCTGCHLGIVHLGNSFNDGNCEFFQPSFQGYNGLQAVKEWNDANQTQMWTPRTVGAYLEPVHRVKFTPDTFKEISTGYKFDASIYTRSIY